MEWAAFASLEPLEEVEVEVAVEQLVLAALELLEEVAVGWVVFSSLESLEEVEVAAVVEQAMLAALVLLKEVAAVVAEEKMMIREMVGVGVAAGGGGAGDWPLFSGAETTDEVDEYIEFEINVGCIGGGGGGSGG